MSLLVGFSIKKWLSCTFGEKAGVADSLPKNINPQALLCNDFASNQLCLSPQLQESHVKLLYLDEYKLPL